ncbi:transglutaminase-like domain-containing protein [Serpentinicella alkaliphila]|uniref:Transglutaminase superfamily protein n=1 Tax=Serpentinicella alkaliphila TaxID=1734049 RepID=A0A4R2T0M0_9FIRM|nr:transglutaminase-like domain-containing protein [Serpentinicella alkaliphila]QUH25708.1 transglutaminase domain-containing protein [Serpentinicella alkaliphila]TCP94831.1 transglutaminase superfamily protein [Serpentinicella alkaliphila]
MKKSIFIIALLFMLSANSVLGQAVINISNLGNGMLVVNSNSIDNKDVRVLVEKGQARYQYNIKEKETRIPLQMGIGSYQVSVVENVGGNRFKVISKETVNVNSIDETNLFLSSIQMVNWDQSMKAVQKAQELTKGLSNDEAKVKEIYNYIINNLVYDFDKVATLTSNYLPNINKIYDENKGICYDYSSLFAGMLRSVGVPTKLVMGYAPNVNEYHAWNEVYINGKWVTIDTTTDAVYRQNNRKYEMAKDKSLFNVMKEY